MYMRPDKYIVAYRAIIRRGERNSPGKGPADLHILLTTNPHRGIPVEDGQLAIKIYLILLLRTTLVILAFSGKLNSLLSAAS